MIKIYHNPRCRKSREGLGVVKKSGKDFEIVKYLEDVPSKKELKDILKCLDITPKMLVRTNEKIWKENFRGKLLSDEELIDAMLAYPKLIQRPIVANGNKAVIGTSSEPIEEILR
ncbi:MAG TPA: arsenate reductase (glutaredoxin) [Pricia antarctica]|uniref:Arsenate reductase (Glutaredoxin) n=1 Tax=Pricia antarctica TaxID=641691 RepID=A0A831QUG6_9FLAO|nr:arsenate reductase (glutaredoxin) [Pricia antarctica]